MAPNIFYSAHAAKWMRDNLETLGDDPIKDVLHLPGSHDAGMWTSSSVTYAASPRQTLTQVVSIYDQLRLGIRWFDIRPMYHLDNWYCGHFTRAGPFKWQGGTGQSIDDVIKDVTQFMKEHQELVVLRIRNW